jgi:hypothetical protein
MNPHKENAAERQILSEIVGLFSLQANASESSIQAMTNSALPAIT